MTQVAEAAFEAAERAAVQSEDAARLAALDRAGQVVFATATALARFEAKDGAELGRRLLTGDGPGARRLRRLAASLPVGEAPRLERLAFPIGRRSASLNLLCARIATPEGPVMLLWEPAPRVRAAEAPAAAPAPMPQEPSPLTPADKGDAPSPSIIARFLWSLDKDGSFGAPDPALLRALGANAPRAGETLAALASRISMETGALARAFELRETFSDLLVLWPLAGRLQARIKLSAAPAFERGREFAGFRGFGRIGEMVAAPPAADDSSAPAAPGDEARPTREPIAPASESSAEAPSATEEPEDQGPAPSAPGRAEPPAAASRMGSMTAPQGSVHRPPPEGRPDESPSDRALAEPERTAAIYVLRQGHGPPGKVVPIRPGAFEISAPERALSAAGESIELSTSERDAFREIARALTGRFGPRREVDCASAAAEPGSAEDGMDRTAPAAPASPEGAALELCAESGAEPRDAAAILDRLPLGVMVVRDARALYLNRTLIDLLGYRDFAHFAAADGLAGLFKDGDPEAVSASDGGPMIPIVRADGTEIAVDGRAQVVTWGGAPATLIAFRRVAAPRGRDAGAPAGASRAMSGAAEELQALLDHATDGAVALDPAGRIVSLNRPAERLFGYQEREVEGESVLMLLQPQSHPEMTARLEALSREDAPSAPSAPIAVVGRDRAGQARPLALTLARIGSGEAPHFGVLVRDLGREQEAERRLIAARDAALAASAAKTGFLAQVSHEIRTPLHAILGFAEVMMEERFGPVGNERYKDYLKDIHASGKHVMSLADDLIDLSKIEAGRFELAFTAVDVNALIRECVSLMQPEAARERVIMRVSLFEHLPRVTADVRSLRQIMLNLISNAVKFNSPGGQVIVSTALDAAGQAVIRVRDTGVGMSESEVGVALEPFGRIAGAPGKAGVGLGLPLAKALVEANGAEFSIKSRRQHGTLIEIAFPVARAAE